MILNGGKSFRFIISILNRDRPYWINYKFLKKKINDIVEASGGIKASKNLTTPETLAKIGQEREFFLALSNEVRKTSDFFESSENLYKIRYERVANGYTKLLIDGKKYDKNMWSRLLRAVVRFYKEVLLLENFAIMNYCGFSKILKKHDKLTGFVTREAFMKNVISIQNFTSHQSLLNILTQSEQLFTKIQKMDRYKNISEFSLASKYD